MKCYMDLVQLLHVAFHVVILRELVLRLVTVPRVVPRLVILPITTTTCTIKGF